ncbi:hypothetical protein J7I93_06410 [Bacillus sp. ISL-47]|uniref:hypothetical protein n=1 Tax=Bacillus sp. ISL-47 TaxID=2819130 RepID=UPI001BE6B849|nr:hypothetical protein [Bacillus sp. ISL-47]MBT2687805.1 hypothetical protein [Bacillus sp. ISL-47]MBT2708118.1 hypothetical protein [Pseudomonas sp. ISL-84]
MKKLFEVTYLLGIEILFGALLLFPFYMAKETEVPLLNYFILVFPAALLFASLLYRFKEKARILFIVTVMPYIFITGRLLSFSVPFMVLLSFFVFWRTLVNFNEHDKKPEGGWALLTIFTGTFLLVFSAILSGIYTEEIVGLMLLKLFFLVAGGFIKRLLDSDAENEEKKKLLLYFISFSGLIGAAGLLIASGMSIFKAIFFGILKIIASAAAFIASPLFIWAEKKDWTEEMKLFPENENEQKSELPEEVVELGENEHFFDPAILLTALFCAVLVCLFIYIYKKNKLVRPERKGMDASSYRISNTALNRGSSPFRRFKNSSPENRIRKEIYQMEKLAAKLQLGRYEFESLSEWMGRIGLKEYDKIVAVYEQVRYSPSEGFENFIEYKQEVDKKKKELIEIKKKNVQEKRAKQKNSFTEKIHKK